MNKLWNETIQKIDNKYIDEAMELHSAITENSVQRETRVYATPSSSKSRLFVPIAATAATLALVAGIGISAKDKLFITSNAYTSGNPLSSGVIEKTDPPKSTISDHNISENSSEVSVQPSDNNVSDTTDDMSGVITEDGKYLPVKNAPTDIDYCDVDTFNPTSGLTTPGLNGYLFIPAENKSRVYATCDGEVVYSDYGFNDGFGAMVIVKCEGDKYAMYYHLECKEGYKVVKEGDIVKAGQFIGLTGISGNTADYGLGYYFRSGYPIIKLP